jgi:hypothetical protein
VKNTTCPGCGAAWNGKRCGVCGYAPFPGTEPHPQKTSPARKKTSGPHPLIGFLILLLLIWALLPGLRRWGLELEARKNAAQHSTQQSAVSSGE